MLRAVQTVTIAGELRTVSFRTLTVEQIGYVYEGLLSFEGFRAAETVVGLIGKDGREEEVRCGRWRTSRRRTSPRKRSPPSSPNATRTPASARPGRWPRS